MSTIITILAFLFMLTLIVVLHEFGHFIVARLFGVHCHEFSIGMGPVLYQRPGKGVTLFSIRAIPIGGYVMMAGEEDGSNNEEDETSWIHDVPESARLNKKPFYQQVCVMLAGIVMNIILAWAIFVGLAFSTGVVAEDAKPIVYEVSENSPAQEAGLQPNDEIIKVDTGKESIVPKTQDEFSEFIQFHHDVLKITVKRNNEEVDLTLKPAYDEANRYYYIGFTSQVSYRKIAWYESFSVGTNNLISSTKSIFTALGQLFKGNGLKELSGPVGIYQTTKQTTEMGWRSYVALIGILSLNIGIFNGLPVPALDGGRVLILCIEKLFRRKINVKVIEYIILASFILLFGLMIFATFNDILRMF
ncbi:MAG: RIP metalloprotease RseP [Bacillota bacterium]|nr:RIP metalloprotease RseP [Bacillota bacterium]